MISTIIIGIIIAVCLVSTLMIYVFMRSNKNLKTEKQTIKYNVKPSFHTIVKELPQVFPFRMSSSSQKSNRSSIVTNYDEDESKFRESSKSAESLTSPIMPIRSTSMVTNLLQTRRPRTPNWRQGSIVDPNQLASIQFTLPLIKNEDKYRRRSVPVLNNIIQLRENPLTLTNSTITCLISFSITYLKSSQLKIQFHSLQGLPFNIQLQQLTIKVKLMPDGKEKSIQIRKYIQNETKFGNEDNEIYILFSNIQVEKLPEKYFSMNIHGKDQAKKNVHLGQIGKINFNQIDQWDNENRIEFIHEIEKIKPVNSNFEFKFLISFD